MQSAAEAAVARVYLRPGREDHCNGREFESTSRTPRAASTMQPLALTETGELTFS